MRTVYRTVICTCRALIESTFERAKVGCWASVLIDRWLTLDFFYVKVHHLMTCLRNGITEPAMRVSSIIGWFVYQALQILIRPGETLPIILCVYYSVTCIDWPSSGSYQEVGHFLLKYGNNDLLQGCNV